METESLGIGILLDGDGEERCEGEGNVIPETSVAVDVAAVRPTGNAEYLPDETALEALLPPPPLLLRSSSWKERKSSKLFSLKDVDGVPDVRSRVTVSGIPSSSRSSLLSTWVSAPNWSEWIGISLLNTARGKGEARRRMEWSRSGKSPRALQLLAKSATSQRQLSARNAIAQAATARSFPFDCMLRY